jgi:predicted nucleic acid-binding protein
MIYLPDTNILIDVITNRKGHAGLLERLLLERHMLTTCAVIVGEVFTGMRAAEEIQTRALMESLEFLPTTYEIARHGGILRRDFARRGQTLSLADTTIAAVAAAYQCTVITENAKDFQIPQLQLYVP